MPFVRFSRDRRGYEHVYLVDAREHGRSRVIFWFRTPPGVKVGRSPFDTATQRSLEQQYPDVKFDWPQIVAARMPPAAPVENWREKRRAERAFKRARAEEAAEVIEREPVPIEPVPAESDSVELDEDGLGSEPDQGESDQGELHQGEPHQDVHEGPVAEPVAIAPAGQPASSAGLGTRRKRRRRRRGRRPDRPADAAAPSSSPDGRLDPAEPPEKPSNEG